MLGCGSVHIPTHLSLRCRRAVFHLTHFHFLFSTFLVWLISCHGHQWSGDGFRSTFHHFHSDHWRHDSHCHPRLHNNLRISRIQHSHWYSFLAGIHQSPGCNHPILVDGMQHTLSGTPFRKYCSSLSPLYCIHSGLFMGLQHLSLSSHQTVTGGVVGLVGSSGDRLLPTESDMLVA